MTEKQLIKAEKIKKRHDECRKLLDEIEAKLGYRPVKTEMTLEEIAKFFGLTRERIRQIEDRAMKKLKHPNVGRALKKYTKE